MKWYGIWVGSWWRWSWGWRNDWRLLQYFVKNNHTFHDWIEIHYTLESSYNMVTLILLPRVQALVDDKLELLELGEGEELLLLARPYVEEHKGHYGHKGLHSH